MKKQFAILLIVVMIFMLFALSGCSDGAKLELPTYADLHSITVQESENGQPVSREVFLHNEFQYYQSHSQDDVYFSTKGYQQITNVSQMPTRDKKFGGRYEFIRKTQMQKARP